MLPNFLLPRDRPGKLRYFSMVYGRPKALEKRRQKIPLGDRCGQVISCKPAGFRVILQFACASQ